MNGPESTPCNCGANKKYVLIRWGGGGRVKVCVGRDPKVCSGVLLKVW